MYDAPIGVFDSGVGGLTVIRNLINRLPEESFIYFGDTAHVPYGNKTRQQLFSYARNIIAFFIQRGVKAIIVACGTHSSVTLPTLKKDYNLPMVGVVKPGAKAAAAITRNGRIGILATQATVDSGTYRHEVEILRPDAQVFQCACTRLVPLIEAGQLEGEEIRSAVKEYVTPLLDKGVDTLILGCTHYPFLVPLIEEIAGDVQLVDPSGETINEMTIILKQNNLTAHHKVTREFLVSGDAQSFCEVGRFLVGDIIQEVRAFDIESAFLKQ